MQPNQNIKKSVNEKELETLAFWDENKIFEKSLNKPSEISTNSDDNKTRPNYTFFDGPPFATGLPHHGTILAGTIKDIMPRYKTMQGYNVRRVWGWDCHGLPIENLIEKELNLNSKLDIEKLGVDQFTKACGDSVMRYDKEWKSIIPRLGRWVDMENAYKTMDTNYTESVWWAWKQLYDKGLAYEGHKIMHICPRCETPLAQSEVGLEYHDITDMTVTAEFELNNKMYNDHPLYVLAWTTTPWTLPGNTALAVNKGIEYVIVESIFEGEKNYYIVAKKLAERVFAKSESYKIVEEINIGDYIGQSYKPVFDTFNNEEYLSKLENSENIWKVWHADFITDESGTGIAHEAPAFGQEDYELAKQNNIPVIKHVLMNGRFVSEVEESMPQLNGLVVKRKDDSISTDIEIVKLLAHNGKLFSKEKIVHSYPLCWRCKTPLLNYATSSWFVDVPKIKDKLISENKKVNWVPAHTRDGRFGKWLEGAREWAVSRNRYWGAPLPIWRSEKTGELKVIGSLDELTQNIKNKSNNNYFVMRHGECNSNVKSILDSSGDLDNHLTPKGVEQIRNQTKKLLDLNIDLIVTSPLIRARESAEVVSESLGGIEIIEDVRLKEFDLGVYDKKSLSEFHTKGTRSCTHLDIRVEGGETHREVKIRVTLSLLDIESKYKNKNVLFVTHGAPGWMLIAGASNMTDNKIHEEMRKDTSEYWLPNAEIFKLDFKNLPRDEKGQVNLHRPHIDKVMLKDSEGNDMKIIGDVFDCWFESGSMPFAQLHYPFENKDIFDKNYPADFIAEGVDQTRGWFYSLLNLGVGLFDKSPYKNVIVNGHVMSEDGTKVSKSSKNYTDPMQLVEKFGADAFRYYLTNSPVMQGEQLEFIDKDLEEVYKKNVARLESVLDFYLMYIDKNAKAEYFINKNEGENVLDKWIINRLYQTINIGIDGYEKYKLNDAISGVDKFVDDLSTWYLRRSRERIKGSQTSESRDAERTLAYVFIEYSKFIAPVMPFLAERIYKEVGGKMQSVHLESFPVRMEINQDIIYEMELVREIVREALMLRQKNNIPVRQPLAKLIINKNIDEKYFEIIMDELNVKEIIIDESSVSCELDFNLTPLLISEGKLRELSRIIKDKRKEMGLVASDNISLVLTGECIGLVTEDYKKEMKIVEIRLGESVMISKV
jgi:isoleucyl-tRNA synthetase